ncbi:hypothetical protein GCM10022224_075350 [Nonomuraea antimicrobica]|uniref:Uncharacterized protein n=1 Tax=Nonomuraea antimicrobica TaxID=561173 RepID=A0ABP7D2N0_9ACTN
MRSGAAVGYGLFVLWQRRARSPLMDVRLPARRPVATGAFLILMATALMIAVFFLGTFYFQHALEYGALQTGLLFGPEPLDIATAIELWVTSPLATGSSGADSRRRGSRSGSDRGTAGAGTVRSGACSGIRVCTPWSAGCSRAWRLRCRP